MHIIWIECADHNSKTPSIIIDREIYIWNGDDLNVGNTRVMEIYVLVIGLFRLKKKRIMCIM